MKYSDIILSANSNLRRSKLRTFLTSSAVFMGALTLMLTSGVGSGLKAYVQEQVAAAGAEDSLIISAKTDNQAGLSNDQPIEYSESANASSGGFVDIPLLSDKDLETVRQTKHVKNATPVYPANPEYIGHGDKRFQATITQGVENLNLPLTAGRTVNVNDDAHEITLSQSFVPALGFRSDQDAIGKTVEIGFKNAAGDMVVLPAQVVGVQEKTFIQANAMNASVALMKEAFLQSTAGVPDFQRFQYPAIFAKYDTSISDEQLNEIKSQLDEKNMVASTLEDQLGMINTIIDSITTFLNIFAVITLAAASFGIVNTLFMSVQERTREIGLMKALGMSRRKIFLLFSLEAVLIGIWSSLIALGAANIIGRIASNIASDTFLKDLVGLELFSFPASSMLVIIAIVTAIAFLASTLPARRAGRLNPIEALRYE